MPEVRELERVVKIAAPYDNSVHAEIVLESAPVWFDLGWQKVDGEDYGPYSDITPARAETSHSVDLAAHSQSLPRTTKSQGNEPGQP